MPVTQKGAISFGLVYIPVALYAATQDNDIRINQLVEVAGRMERVQYKKTCKGCKHDLTNDDIAKGFQYSKDKYVIVSDEDFEKIKTEKDRSVQILQFSEMGEISPVYYEKAYRILPEKGGEKAFELLRRAMSDSGKIAVGKTVLGTKETTLILVPEETGILMQTLYYQDEIKELSQVTARPEVGKPELEMAEKLIESMVKPFKPEAFKDEYQDRLREMIQKKIEGKEVTAPKDRAPDNVIDLMDALKASLEAKPVKGKPKARKAG